MSPKFQNVYNEHLKQRIKQLHESSHVQLREIILAQEIIGSLIQW